jgi:soluble lytic murein transglycosylase
MKFRTILALIAVGFAGVTAQAQNAGDDAVLEMAQAFRQGNKVRLAQLLPAVAWPCAGAVGGLLGTARPPRHRQPAGGAGLPRPLRRHLPGRPAAQRLAAVLGQRRDWTTFADEHPRFRMNDDVQVKCYALLVRHVVEGPAAPATLADDVRRSGSASAATTTPARWPPAGSSTTPRAATA